MTIIHHSPPIASQEGSHSKACPCTPRPRDYVEIWDAIHPFVEGRLNELRARSVELESPQAYLKFVEDKVGREGLAPDAVYRAWKKCVHDASDAGGGEDLASFVIAECVITDVELERLGNEVFQAALRYREAVRRRRPSGVGSISMPSSADEAVVPAGRQVIANMIRTYAFSRGFGKPSLESSAYHLIHGQL